MNEILQNILHSEFHLKLDFWVIFVSKNSIEFTFIQSDPLPFSDGR